jgi:iron(III) transport system substrate-binding protein
VATRDPDQIIELERLADRRLGRRGAVATAAGLLAFRLASPLNAFAQDASPEADAEPDPEPDPEADPEADPDADPEAGTGAFTLYSGRNEALVGPLIEQYAEETGNAIDVRFGSTGELAATIAEEGDNTPAAAFFAQDAGALGLLADEGRFQELPEEVLELVDPQFRDPEGRWIGVTGRARVLAYNTDALAETDLPASVHDLTDPAWSARIGWAPENASFQAFITAFRILEGEEAAKGWLDAMIANGTVNFADSNAAIVEAVGRGEIDAGLVNNYYVYVVGQEQGADFPVANHYFEAGDPGSLINVAGVGLIAGAEASAEALAFIEYLLSDEGQEYFATNTFEYPLVTGIAAPEGQKPLSEIGHPEIDLSDLADLRGTLDLLAEVGLI